MPSVLSVNVHAGEPSPPAHGTKPPSGIHKTPVEFIDVVDPAPRALGGREGVQGDVVRNRKHHGGRDQAVYAFAREELAYWESVLGRELSPGFFGENLTTIGLAIDDAPLRQRWRVGTALLEVSAHRTPCATFAAQVGVPRWVKTFTEHGRTGAYLRVIEPGRIDAGDAIAIVSTPDHGISVADCFRAAMGDVELARRIVELGLLGEDHAPQMAALVARRG